MFSNFWKVFSNLNLKRFIKQNGEFYRYSQGGYKYFFITITYYFVDIISQVIPGLKKTAFLEKIHRYLNKVNIFFTPFGNFLFDSSNLFMISEYYEIDIRELVLKNCERNKNIENKVFLNIGANIGRWGIELSKNFGYKSYMFEPTPKTFRYLKINTILSEIEDRVELFNFALGNENSILKFENFLAHNGGNRVYQDYLKTDFSPQTIDVPVKRFDDLGISINSKDVKLILMDVEGYELNVLKGMHDFLSQLKDVEIIVEIWSDNIHKKETIKYMEELGYTSRQVDIENVIFSK